MADYSVKLWLITIFCLLFIFCEHRKRCRVVVANFIFDVEYSQEAVECGMYLDSLFQYLPSVELKEALPRYGLRHYVFERRLTLSLVQLR